MKVSIVTISYNQAEFLERTIRSVIDQDYADIEYIVVDPGSTDGSRAIIECYRSKIHNIIFESDQGPADGLNKGFEHATGGIYGFLNSDDVLFPGAISQIVEFFNSHPQVDIVSGHSIIIDEYDRKTRKSYSDHFSLICYAYQGVSLMQPSTFFRAQTFKQTNGFNTSNKSNWDGELFVTMRLQGARFALIKGFLSGYRVHEESITSSKKLDEKIRAYSKSIFKVIMGRERGRLDLLLMRIFKLVKYVKNPPSLYARLTYGPVYGANKRS